MIHHGDTETRSKLLHEGLTETVIGAAIEVHRALGTGLLESAYEECLCRELHLRDIAFRRQVPLPIEYKGVKLDRGYRLDLIVQDSVVLELKCVEHILPSTRSTIGHLFETVRNAGRAHHQLRSCDLGEGRDCEKGFVKVLAFLRVSVSPW